MCVVANVMETHTLHTPRKHLVPQVIVCSFA